VAVEMMHMHANAGQGRYNKIKTQLANKLSHIEAYILQVLCVSMTQQLLREVISAAHNIGIYFQSSQYGTKDCCSNW